MPAKLPGKKLARAFVSHKCPHWELLSPAIEHVPSDFIFSTSRNASGTFDGWSKAKTALDQRSGVSAWTLHDLRRTFATKLAELGTPPHIIENLLNHITGTISGVAAIYNRYKFEQETRKAVDLYAAHLTKILE